MVLLTDAAPSYPAQWENHQQLVHKSCLNLLSTGQKHLQSSQQLLELNGPQKNRDYHYMQCAHKNRLHSLIGSLKHLQKVHKNYPNLFCIGYKNMQSSEKWITFTLNGPQ